MKLSNNVSETAIRKSFENQGFNKPQARELWLCVAHNVDTTQIANVRYNPLLMRYIRVALQVNDKLDVDKLLAEYNRQIRLGKVKSLSFKELQMLRMEPYKKERKKKRK